VVFSGDWPLSNRQIQKVLADFKESPLADDVVPAQLEGFGADNFLVLNEKKAQRSFRIVAEFKAASGSFRTRAYMANAINTWPKLAEEAFVQIGDFFKMSLEAASRQGFEKATLAVFFGKALKMAQGVPHTHAARASLTLDKLAGWTREITGNRELAQHVLAANTARHAFDIIGHDYPGVIGQVGKRIVKSAQRFGGPDIRIQSIIFDYTGNVVFDSDKP
jgi:cobalamin biosynthesis protein CbiD